MAGTPKPKITIKPTPKPTFTPPTVAQYKQSAAYRSNTSNMTYKEYVNASKVAWNARNKKK